MTKTKTNAEEHRRREKACTACGTKETVQWRKGARGECLCNACGVRFLRRGRKKEGEGTWEFSNTIENTFANADAILILTEWQEYSRIDWAEAYKMMRKPAWVFDSRSIIEPKKVIDAGINIWRIGDGLR